MSKILIAEEDPTVRTLLHDGLCAEGIEILFAPTGAEATAQIEQETPVLVISDVYLPDMDGYRICEFVKSHPRLSATPVLLVADVVDATVLARSARVHADDVLRKPFGVHPLLARIRSLLPPAPLGDPVFSRSPETPDAATEPNLENRVARLAALPGVTLCVLVDDEGFLIAGAGAAEAGVEAAGALVGRLAQAVRAIDCELGEGGFRSVRVDRGEDIWLLTEAEDGATLGIVARNPAAIDTVRRAVARAFAECSSHAGLASVGAA